MGKSHYQQCADLVFLLLIYLIWVLSINIGLVKQIEQSIYEIIVDCFQFLVDATDMEDDTNFNDFNNDMWSGEDNMLFYKNITEGIE